MASDDVSQSPAEPRIPSPWERLQTNPELVLPGLLALLNGWWHRLKFCLLGQRFRCGPWLRIYGRLTLSGPGQVRLGSHCLIISNAIKPVCIRTLSRAAEVILEDHAGLNGTAIQCLRRVHIGRHSNIADAYITDTAAHVLARDRRARPAADAAQGDVVIGNNVWVSVNTVILHGVHIGDNSVIGACSLVRSDVPADVFCAGNPLKVIKPIPA
jgi:acetyltransferase-like isoleucine patch superfamily enzyme